jgi:hypothetical protein
MSKKLDIPSHHTLKKYCPLSYDVLISTACGLETCEDLLKQVIEKRGHKRILFIRASDLSALSRWANSDIIARWLVAQEGAIIEGYRLTTYQKMYSGNGSLYQLKNVNGF